MNEKPNVRLSKYPFSTQCLGEHVARTRGARAPRKANVMFTLLRNSISFDCRIKFHKPLQFRLSQKMTAKEKRPTYSVKTYKL